MDDTLRIIRYLYDEEPKPADLERQLADDEELRAEYTELHAVKKQLDRRAPQRPDADILDRITEAACTARQRAQRSDQPRPSREAREPVRSSTRRRQRVGMALATVMVVIVAVGLWQYPDVLPGGSDGAAMTTEQGQPATSTAEQRVADERPGELPAWDEADDVIRIYRHIETLQSRSRPGSWDTGTLPLRQASQQ